MIAEYFFLAFAVVGTLTFLYFVILAVVALLQPDRYW